MTIFQGKKTDKLDSWCIQLFIKNLPCENDDASKTLAMSKKYVKPALKAKSAMSLHTGQDINTPTNNMLIIPSSTQTLSIIIAMSTTDSKA